MSKDEKSNNPMASTSGADVSDKLVELIAGHSNIDDFSKATLRDILSATKASNQLPSEGNDFDYYNTFESFRHIIDIESTRILELIHHLFRYFGTRGNIKSSRALEVEEKFDILVDANDQLLERVGIELDEASGLKRKEPVLSVISSPKLSTNTSWNKKIFPKADKGQGLRLLTAKQIIRPQLSFTDKIDNSARPFVPKITHKPNALRPLQNSILLAQSTHDVKQVCDPSLEPVSYPHPYEYELDRLTYTDRMLSTVKPTDPVTLDSSTLTYIDTEQALKAMIKTIRRETEIAVDLEAHSYRTYLGITCLMQLSTRTHDYIIDTLCLRGHMYLMNAIFTDPDIVKVFHGADMDIVWLQRDFGVYVVNMFDSGQASRILSYPRYSLAYLLENLCSVEADKQYQLADWRMRPLPAELINYARSDTHYLLYMYDKLKNELISKSNSQLNLLNSVLDRSKMLCQQVFKKPVHDSAHLKFLIAKTNKTYNNCQMIALRDIADWRVKIAQREDESINYILPNHMMLKMAEILPREAAGVLACCNPIPPFVKQYLHEIHEIVQTARENPASEIFSPQSFAIKTKIRTEDLEFLESPHDTLNSYEPVEKMDVDESKVSVHMKASALLLLDQPPTRKSKSKAQQLAAKIRASMVSPLAMYQRSSKSDTPTDAHLATPLDTDTPTKSATPPGTESVPECDGELDTSLTTNKPWKLLPNTKLHVKTKVNEKEPSKILIKKPSTTEEEQDPDFHEMPDVTLREQATSERKRGVLEAYSVDANSDVEEVEFIEGSHEIKKRKQTADQRPVKPEDRIALGEKVEPYGYDTADFDQFISKSKKKKKFARYQDGDGIRLEKKSEEQKKGTKNSGKFKKGKKR